MTRISFITRPPYLSSMGLDDDPIHKDLHADEDMGDGVVCWWSAVFLQKKHWTYLDRLSIIWSDWSCGKALVCVSQWRQNGTTMSWGTSPHTHSCAPHMCTAIVHKKSKLWHEGPRILIVLLILKFNYQVFIFSQYLLLCSAHAPNKSHRTHTRTHSKPQRPPSLMALVVLHIYDITSYPLLSSAHVHNKSHIHTHTHTQPH